MARRLGVVLPGEEGVMFRGTPEFNRAKLAEQCVALELAIAADQSVYVVSEQGNRWVRTQQELDEYLDERGQARAFPWLVSEDYR